MSTQAVPSCCHSAQQQAALQATRLEARYGQARSSGNDNEQATPSRCQAPDDGEEVCQVVGSSLKQAAPLPAAAAAAGSAAASERLPLGSVHLPILPLSVVGTRIPLGSGPQQQQRQQGNQLLTVICARDDGGTT